MIANDDDSAERERKLAFFLHRLHDIAANQRSRRTKPYKRDFKVNRLDEWVCNDFPNCTCGRATGYPKPLHKYNAAATEASIVNCYVTLKCISNHVPDRNMRIDAGPTPAP